MISNLRHWIVVIGICSLCLELVSCNQTAAPIAGQFTPVPTLRPTAATIPTDPPALFESAAIEPEDTGWISTGAGVAIRQLNVFQSERLAPVSIVRLDPARVRFRVGYAPNAPHALTTWHSENNALATINGGFFDEFNQTTALVISGGVASGSSYQESGGMFAVDAEGNVSLRYLAEQPYDPAEPLTEALQSWPMLITAGGNLTYTSADDGQRARRSVVAIDQSGNILLLACPGNDFTLRGLADWLLISDLAIDAALNLDGGSSTGLYFDSDDQKLRIPAFVPLPITLMAVRG